MDGPVGVRRFLGALTLGVVMMIFDGFEMPRALIFFAQRVIQTDIEGPLAALRGRGHQVLYKKSAHRRPYVLRHPGANAQRVGSIRGVGSINDEPI